MALSANVALSITPLPENDTWFANAQAWNNYWRDVSGDVTFNPIDTQLYASVTLVPADNVTMEIDGVPMVLITQQNYDQLVSKVEALDASYQSLRTQLRDAGLISNAQ